MGFPIVMCCQQVKQLMFKSINRSRVISSAPRLEVILLPRSYISLVPLAKDRIYYSFT